MESTMPKRRVAILGSTGSIGRQALEIIAEHPQMYEVELLCADKSWEMLAEQAIRFDANNAVICDASCYDRFASALSCSTVKTFAGMDSVCDLIKGENIDIVLSAIVGFSGLRPAITAIESGKALALANKETLVAAGNIVMSLAARHSSPILPVDSEHSAIFQALQGASGAQIEKLLITASGGPFLDRDRSTFGTITPQQALNHPKWKMGAKITIDSATLVNKGLEVIEARWLFSTPPEKIEVIIHPESIIHSMVQFTDGAILAQMGAPDMRIPIQYAMTYPSRVALKSERINFHELGKMTFRAPDREAFPALDLAYCALREGGNMACTLNSANEVAVEAFLNGQLPFTGIARVIATCMDKAPFIPSPNLEAIFETDMIARELARKTIENLN